MSAWGPLAGLSQREDVIERVGQLQEHCQLVHGGNDFNFEAIGADRNAGAFYPPTLLFCPDPFETEAPHSIEAFGPVSTLMPYDTLTDAVKLAALGKGSLVGSVVTYDDDEAREIVFGAAAYHGRMLILNRDCAKESTGHGSPLAPLVHGGPGRAGGRRRNGGHSCYQGIICNAPLFRGRPPALWPLPESIRPVHERIPMQCIRSKNTLKN